MAFGEDAIDVLGVHADARRPADLHQPARVGGGGVLFVPDVLCEAEGGLEVQDQVVVVDDAGGALQLQVVAIFIADSAPKPFLEEL